MNRAQAILDTILSIQPKEGASIRGGETRENVVYKLADDVIEKMLKNYVDHEVKRVLNRMVKLFYFIFLNLLISLYLSRCFTRSLLDGVYLNARYNSIHFSHHVQKLNY